MTQFNLLIKNGRIIDGTGNPSFHGDVGLKDGKITAVERQITGNDADEIIDAQGLAIAPGFIDPHTHDDLYVLEYPSADAKILQGITTVMAGNCGYSVAPLDPKKPDTLPGFTSLLGGSKILHKFVDVTSIGDYLDLLDEINPGINVGTLVGNVTLRIAAMGFDMRPPTDHELAEMKHMVTEAMQAGAFGLSSGLIYAPGSYASTKELVELAKSAAAYDGIYASHIRGEGQEVEQSVSEAIHIGETAGLPVQISHFKASGKINWGKTRETIKLVEAARQRGKDVTADQYPYTASSTGLFSFLPITYLSKGFESLQKQLADTGFRAQLKEAIVSPTNLESNLVSTGFQAILVTISPSFPDYVGRNIQDIADEFKRDPYDILFDLIEKDGMAAIGVFFSISDDDVMNVMRQPWIMMGSDGLPNYSAKKIHPRMTGTAPRILGHYVREKGVITLEDAIRKMTSLPAQTFGFKGKGLLKPGFDADVTLFDPDTIIDKSTYDSPFEPPAGIPYVIVNGKMAVRDGKVTGKAIGKVLRHNQ